MHLRPGSLIGAMALIGWSTAVALAQLGSGLVAGTVRDTSAAPIAGATVTLRHVPTGHVRVVTTSADGLYAVTGLAPGPYCVTVALPGFATVARTVVVRTGEAARVDLTLGIGGVAESVQVTTTAPVLNASSAGLGTVVSHESVVELPLNGRTFVSLAALAPGVALPPRSLLPRINGGRPRTNEYLFDGISVLQPEPGQVAFFPVIDAIQEFKVESNSPPAEFGRFNGGVINLTTKAGTNAFHGDGFEFLRHEALNARNFFASTLPQRPRFRRSQFGGVAGGPIRRDRTFFFVDYQGQRQVIERTAISTVPTLLQRRGVFTEAIGARTPIIYDPGTTSPAPDGTTVRAPFPGNAIPIDRMDPLALALLQRYPLPTTAGTANNYRRVASEIDDQNQIDARVDQRLNGGRDLIFGRASVFHERLVPVAPLPDGSGAATGTPGPQTTRARSAIGHAQHLFGDRLLNELRAGDTSRSVSRRAARLPDVASTSLGVHGIPSTARFADTLPTFVIAGYQQLGSPPNTASEFSTGVTEVADALSWVRGRHSVKAGVDVRWERLDVIQPPSPTGTFQFSELFTDRPGVTGTGSPLASFLLGQVQSFSIDLQQKPIRNRAHVQEYFVQDDWRPRDGLTLNAGVRYTLNFPSAEVDDQSAVFDLKARRLQYLGRDDNPRTARELHKLNFGPRIGIVGRISEREVVRAGYGLIWIEQAGITTPFTTPSFPFLQTVSQRTLDNLHPAFVLATGPAVQPIPLTPDAGVGQGVFAVDRSRGSGYAQQWNASYQRQLGAHSAIELAYVGSWLAQLGVPDTNLNQLTREQLAMGPALLQRVPNPYFGRIPRSSSLGDPTIPVAQLLKPYPEYSEVSMYRNNVGTSHYEGVEARLEHRLSHGLSFLVSYTRSKLVDDASSVFDASVLTGPVATYPVADSFDRRSERDVSTGDLPHVLTASGTWQPGRWTLAAIVTLQSGAPIAVTQATNFNAFAGYGIQRPNRVADPELPADGRSADRWFDTSAFAIAPAFTLGSSSRNPVRGPAYRNVDLAVARRVPLRRGIDFELRTEIFNLTNTPPLGAANGVLGSPGFGAIATAGDPRVVQIGARLLF